MYRCICNTCCLDQLYEEFETAQGIFNDHANNLHEVELEKVEVQSRIDHTTDRTSGFGTDASASASKGGAVGDE